MQVKTMVAEHQLVVFTGNIDGNRGVDLDPEPAMRTR
jgi:hypothetical protein